MKYQVCMSDHTHCGFCYTWSFVWLRNIFTSVELSDRSHYVLYDRETTS